MESFPKVPNNAVEKVKASKVFPIRIIFLHALNVNIILAHIIVERL